MKALVTGGGGFLGRHMVKRLRERGDEVRVLARGEYPQLVAMGASCSRGDIRDPESVARAVEGVDAVLHTAARVGSWGARPEFESINVAGTRNVIEACKKARVSRLVYTSSPSVVMSLERSIEGGDETLPFPKTHLNHYSATKAQAETMILAANDGERLKTVALRPHFIFGPGDAWVVPRVLRHAREGTLIRIGDGANKIDVTYIDNAVDAHLLALDALAKNGAAPAGQAYFIGQEAPVRLWGFIDRVISGFGVGLPKRTLSLRTARMLGAILEGIWGALGRRTEPPLTRAAAVTLGTSHYFSHEKARRDFGYEPAISIDEGLHRLFEYGEQPSPAT
jgi:nucleoside-diphosphate-sugar epimerase